MTFNQEDYNKICTTYTEKVGERKSLLKQKADMEEEIIGREQRGKDGEKARAIIQEVARQTQQKLEYHFTKLVTTALKAVSPDFPEFAVQIEIRRNKPECDLLFKTGENTVDKPLDSSGGGPLDVASFALRIAYWSLRKNRSTLILDEPFRFLSPDLHEKAGDMLKMVSQKLGVQIIMVSHSETVNLEADKTFLVSKIKGISKVKEVN